eukprot:Blabericola_migrator_1__12119@NODE_747_length_6663_cov_33_227259_g331_i2_p4_GENE_NODE_747_length_6663_cov_33_227259_g331_i2NODE_747_length_6663_cov_33_227259_g331_i2_p4_ORF_typecomplete_len178_score29_60_NODE_747_length_6663_cov_33_227259_g331_i260026535
MCLQKERSNFRTFESDICQLIRDEAKQSKVLVAMVNVIDALEGKFDPTSDDDIDVYCEFLEHRDRAFKSMQMTLHQVLGAGALVVWRRFEKLIRKVLFTGDLNVTVAEYLDQALATPPLYNRLAEVEMSWLKNKDEQDITLGEMKRPVVWQWLRQCFIERFNEVPRPFFVTNSMSES